MPGCHVMYNISRGIVHCVAFNLNITKLIAHGKYIFSTLMTAGNI